MVFGALSIAEATVIDNLPRTGYMGGFGDSGATYWGQSFLAEPGLAQSLTFELRYESGDGDLNFRLLLTTVDGQWNGVDYSEVNPGMVLFESESLSLAHMPHNSEWILFSVELGGIDLEDGQTYAFVLDAFEDGDGIQSKALVGMRDGYQDGHTFWLGYSKTYLEDSFPNSDRDYYFNNLYWGNNVDRAMAFSLTFIPVPEPCTIDDILNFFDESVDAGTIYGRGKIPCLANFRLYLFRQMLETAKSFIEKEKMSYACRILNRAVLRCDSEPWPKDFIKGEAVPELSQMIEDLIECLQCD